MPPLSADEYDELRASIEKIGVTVPVIVDDDGNVIDGHHRVTIAQELGVQYPTRVVSGLSEDEKIEQSVILNIARRQLTREQRRSIIAEQLKRHPEKSNREHARQLGVDDKTVGSVRNVLEERAEIPHVETRTDSLGREQPAYRPSPFRSEFHDEAAGLHIVDDTDDTEGFVETVDALGGTTVATDTGELIAEQRHVEIDQPAPSHHTSHTRVIDNDDDAELDNARTASKRLGSALATLEGFQWPQHRDRIINRWWPKGKDVVPPDQRDLFNPEHLRAIADALQITATELEAQSHE